MDIVSRAIQFATKAHHGMMRKKDHVPYILHPLEAAVIVGTMTSDQEIIAAAVLHDVVEDAGITIEQIEEQFGSRVRFLVEAETENKRTDLPANQTWKIRKQESLDELARINDLGVLMVWLGDKLANMRSFYRIWKTEGNQMWQQFNQKDPTEQAWYYLSIAKLTEPLSHTTAWLEYKTLTEMVFTQGDN